MKPIVAHEARRDAGGRELAGVGFPLVAQRVELGDHDQRWRQPLPTLGQKRRGVGAVSILEVRRKMVPEPVHGFRR